MYSVGCVLAKRLAVCSGGKNNIGVINCLNFIVITIADVIAVAIVDVFAVAIADVIAVTFIIIQVQRQVGGGWRESQ